MIRQSQEDLAEEVQETNTIVVPFSDLSATIEDLENFAVYKFEILGFTSLGDGVISPSTYGGRQFEIT